MERRTDHRLPLVRAAAALAVAALALAGPAADVASGRTGVVADVTVGIAPIGVTVGHDGDVWVANDFSESVSRVSPATDTVIATVPMAGSALAAATGADGDVWVTEGDGSSADAARIDPATNAVLGVVDLGDVAPGSMAVGRDGHVWVVDQGPGAQLFRIDPDLGPVGQLVGTIAFPDRVSTVAVGADGYVWVNGQADPRLYRIDPAGGPMVTSVLPAETAGMAVGTDGDLWLAAADLAGSSVLRRSPNPDGTTTAAGQVPITLQNPYPVVVGADGDIWVADEAPGPPTDVVRIRPTTTSGTVIGTVATQGSMLSGMATGVDGSIWVSSYDTQQVFRVAVTTDITGGIRVAPATVTVGATTTLTLSLRGTDPDNAAVGTVARIRFPAGVALVAGPCTATGGGATCDLGQVGPAPVDVPVTLRGTAVGQHPVDVTVTWANPDTTTRATAGVVLQVVAAPAPTPTSTTRPAAAVVTPRFTG